MEAVCRAAKKLDKVKLLETLLVMLSINQQEM